MPTYSRDDRALFRFSGPDAAKLLNDVLTAKFAAADGSAQWWALLSPQGKVQAEGLAAWHAEGFYLDVHFEAADSFFKRMKLYRLRAKVEIEDLRDSHKVGYCDSATEGDREFSAADSRLPGLGFRLIAPIDAATASTQGDAYHARRIALGVPELGADYPADQLFPHDMGMDQLSGVDFAKGCYVGQEVVSRMQHRGTARRRPVIVDCGAAEKGAPLVCEGKEAGTLGQVVDGKAVAVVRLDRITDPAACTIAGNAVALALPDWARYDFADSAGAPETGETH